MTQPGNPYQTPAETGPAPRPRVATPPVAGPPSEVLRNSRREAALAFAAWFGAMVWSVGWCYAYGYNRAPDSLTYVLGFPDWVFWGIVTPWAVCFCLSYGFSASWVKDEDLGTDQDEGLDD